MFDLRLRKIKKMAKKLDDNTTLCAMSRLLDDYFKKYCFEFSRTFHADGDGLMLNWKGDIGGRTMFALLSTKQDLLIVGLNSGMALSTPKPKYEIAGLLEGFDNRVLKEWRENHTGTAKKLGEEQNVE